MNALVCPTDGALIPEDRAGVVVECPRCRHVFALDEVVVDV